MSKQVAYIPLNTINRIQIYINKNKKSLSQIKAETGASYIINGGLYEPDWTPCCHLKVDGVLLHKDQYKYWGLGWNTGSDVAMVSDYSNLKNYICCTTLIDPNGLVKKLTYTPAQGGNRGRTAIGLKGNNLALYASGDGTRDTNTPEGLQDELNDMGWDKAIMLDSGGSSQCDMNGKIIFSTREVHNLILVYTNKNTNNTPKEESKPTVSKKYTVCLDAGHDPSNKANRSPDATYYEYEFAWDMSQRIKPLLEANGINTVMIKTENEAKDLADRAKVSNDAKADLFLSLHTNATASTDGTGWSSARGLVVYTSSAGATAGRNIAANKIIDRMREANVLVRSTALAHNNFVVLVKTNAPACLIEYGFHTNKEDVALLKNPAYRDLLAIATVKGICDFFGIAYKAKETVEQKPETPTPTTPPVTEPNYGADTWAMESVKKAVTKGIFTGDDKGNYKMKDAVTRQELCILFDRLGLLD